MASRSDGHEPTHCDEKASHASHAYTVKISSNLAVKTFGTPRLVKRKLMSQTTFGDTHETRQNQSMVRYPCDPYTPSSRTPSSKRPW